MTVTVADGERAPEVRLDRSVRPRSTFAAGRSVRQRKGIESVYRSALREQLGRARSMHTPGMRFRVVQVGLDAGRWVSALDSEGLEFTGLGTDVADLAAARHNYPEHDFEHVPWDDGFPLGTESVDAAFAVMALQTQPVAGRRWLVREMFRVLRPGGWLIIADEFVSGGLYGHAWRVEGLTSLLDLLILSTGTRLSLLHMESLRYPGDRIHRAALLNLAKIGVPTQW